MTKRILKTLKEKYPGVWYKIHGGLYQEAGIPDIIGCYKGAFFAFEVKRPGRENRVSAHQQYQLDRLRAAHATVGVVSSVAETVKIMEYIKNAI
jgi:penicillin-binding protein-related factor A (putative recombinase)